MFGGALTEGSSGPCGRLARAAGGLIAVLLMAAGSTALAQPATVAQPARAQADNAPAAAPGTAARFPGIGRSATPAEIRAWDIDVRADFKGLPPGKGTVALGEKVWEAQCASCHGYFGESNEFFPPIVGGTTAEDMKRGRVAGLVTGSEAQRTTLMKLPHVATLWDYIHRAMPFTAPKTLSTEEVYAVTAYILHLGNIVPADFELSDRNIAQVQARLPNRNGMRPGMAGGHGLWSARGKGDVQATACMRNCDSEVVKTSVLPDHARDAHGNLAQQNRLIGPVRGADTTKPALTEPVSARSRVALAAAAPAVAQAAPVTTAKSPAALASQFACVACHAPASRLVGPGWQEIAARYADRTDAANYLAGKIRSGGQGVWGPIPMPAQVQVSPDDAGQLARWILEFRR
ncbi:MAG TPA: c-type cytochrome [Burkholderiaceae bacterium]|nr:c-type cytochrome [Burkholderiaceae bacterium]